MTMDNEASKSAEVVAETPFVDVPVETEGATPVSEESTVDVQKLQELKNLVDTQVAQAREEESRRLQSIKDREVGKVHKEKKELAADLGAAQAGLGFVIETVTKGLDPERQAEFKRGLEQSVRAGRERAMALPPQEQELVTEANMVAVELRRSGIAVNMGNPATSDPRLDFTLPSTFISSANEILKGIPAKAAPVAAKKPAIVPPVVDEAGRKSTRQISNEQLHDAYAMGTMSRAEYIKQCNARGIEL